MLDTRIRFLVILAVALLVGFLRLSAQPDPVFDSGMKPYGSFHAGDIDNVNLENGQLTLNIPIADYAQRGGRLHLGFFANYTNQTVQQSIFTVRQQQFVAFIPNGQTGVAIRDDFLPTLYKPGIGEVRYDVQSPDGALHQMLPITNASGTYSTTDGTSYLYQQVSSSCNSNGQILWVLIDRNGTRLTRPCVSVNGAYQAGTFIEDSNGNKMTATYDPTYAFITGWSDSLGRSINAASALTATNGAQGGWIATSDHSTDCKGPLTVAAAYTWTLPGGNGATNTYKICTADVSIQLPSSLCTGIPNCSVDNTSLQMIQSIYLPTGTYWIFTYDNGHYGDLLSITFPTGGTLSYTWTNFQTYNQVCATENNFSRMVATRTLNANDGTGPHTWTYTLTQGPGSPPTIPPQYMTVQDPYGNQTVHTFNSPSTKDCGYYETEIQSYKGSSTSGTLLKTVTKGYHSDYVDPVVASINVAPIITTTIWPNGQKTETDKGYESLYGLSVYGNALYDGFEAGEWDYDYASGTPPLVRATYRTSLAGSNSNYSISGTRISNIIDEPASVVVQNSTGTEYAQTTYNYDQYAVTSSGVTTNLDTNPPDGQYRGNLTSTVRWLNGTAVATPNCNVSVTNGYLTNYNTYYDTGEVYKSLDPCATSINDTSHTTTYGYSSAYAGGFVTSTTNPLGQTTGYNYDIGCGSKTSVTDPNGKTTSYTYDELCRLSAASFPDNGSAIITYQESTPPFTATLSQLINSTSGSQKVTTNIFDGVGRVSETELTSDPDGTVYNYMTYDAVGRKYQVWNPSRCDPAKNSSCSSESTWGKTTFLYDPLDRPTIQTQPDGSTLQWCYNDAATAGQTNCHAHLGSASTGIWVDAADENGNDMQSTTDGLGRLTTVMEPNGASQTPSLETDYTYDLLDNLTRVYQKGNASSDTARVRNFASDNLSRLTSATNVESGTTTYTYDADGNLITKTSPAVNQSSGTQTLGYCYDTLNRVTYKFYSGSFNCASPSGFVSEYAYDGHRLSDSRFSSVTFTNPVGQLTDEIEYSGSTLVSERLPYQFDARGRLLAEEQDPYAPAGNQYKFVYQYDLLGDRDSFTNGSAIGSSVSVPAITWDAITPDGRNDYDGAQRLSILRSTTPWGNTASFPEYLVDLSSTSPVSYNPFHQTVYTQAAETVMGSATPALKITGNYDTRDRQVLESAVGSGEASPANVYSYTISQGGYAPNGNILTYSDSIMGNWAFQYDTLNRLTQMTRSSTPPGSYPNNLGCYAYDDFGNRTLDVLNQSSNDACSSHPSTEYSTYNAQNQTSTVYEVTDRSGTDWVTSVALTYDDAGDVRSDNLNNYVYDADGRICAVQKPGPAWVGYLYDAEGRRIAKGTLTSLSCNLAGNGFSLTNEYLLDDAGNQVTELNNHFTGTSTMSWAHSNLWLGSHLAATYDMDTATTAPRLHFHLSDPLGTRRVEIAPDGTVTSGGMIEAYFQSLPYGDGFTSTYSDPNSGITLATADDATTHHFTGKERDAESGLDYFGARYYASTMGRWMSPDWSAKAEPVPYSKLDNPQSLNLYSYVYNNPLSKADPDGHCAEDFCVVEGLTAGTVAAIATVGATSVYLATPSGQRSLSTFTSAFSSSVSSSVSSIKNFFSSSKATPAAPVGATPATPTAAPAVPGTQTNQPKSNPMTGTPGSTSQTTQPDGSPKQVRRYGPDGHPETDVDHGHDHGQGDPHAHDWGRPSDGSAPTHTDRGPGRPVTPNDPKPQ